MDRLAAIVEVYDLWLVEDGAQPFVSLYKGCPCGSLGDMVGFSFHETKNAFSGEGGPLTVIGPDLIMRAEKIREKGTNGPQFYRGMVDEYTWVEIGPAFLPRELVASFLNAQSEVAAMINTRRRAMFDRHLEAFADPAESEWVRLPICPADCVGDGDLFNLLMQDGVDRDCFIQHIRADGVTTPFHHVPLHYALAGLSYGRISGNRLKVTDDVLERLVRLLLFFDMCSEMETVIDVSLSDFDRGHGP